MDKFGVNGPMLLFQIVHFLLLTWLLRRLLYEPVMDAYEGRKTKIADSLAEAERVAAQAAQERAAACRKRSPAKAIIESKKICLGSGAYTGLDPKERARIRSQLSL